MKAYAAVSARPLVAALLFALASSAFADASAPPASREGDPDERVYVVMARDTHAALRTLGRGIAKRDGIGTPLVIVETPSRRLADVAAHVHENEQRCGGYFAFATRAEAEAFVANDRSAVATSKVLAASYTIDNGATVNPWLPTVSGANIRTTIAHLTSYRNRHYTTADGKAAAEWIKSTWAGLAGTRTDVTAELYTGCTNCSTQPSVILTVPGTDLPNEVVVIGAHLDSISNAGSGALMTAPGADDDASGVATLTEIIRIALADNWKPRRTVKFMAYAAEEAGLRGSNAIAQSFKNTGVNVAGVLQLDMTNYKAGNVADMKLVTDFSNEGMKTFLTNLFDTYLAPLGYTRGTHTCGYGCSDHASWTAAGFPSAMMFEAGVQTGYNPNIHTANDTLASMGDSAQNSVKFAQLGLAFLGELGKTQGGAPPANAPPVANFGVATNGLTATFTDSSTDSDGTIASRAWTFGDGGTSTAANPTRTYAAAGTYSVALTVTDNAGATNVKTSAVTVSGGGAQTYQNDTDVAITDHATVESAIVVSGRSGNAPANTPVTIAIVHSFIGDLTIDLVAPDGSTYNLHNRTGGGTRNINKTVTLNLASETLNGTWRLRVRDSGNGDVGRIDRWSVRF